MFSAAGVALAFIGLSACADSTSIDWKKLTKVTDATSLQKATELEDENMSLIHAGLQQYNKLLHKRTTENQDRAKLLYSRIQMHAHNSVILAGDFNRLAELEMLHLGWATSLTAPYTQSMDNRIRAFESSAAIYRTMPVMRPVNDPTETRNIYYSNFDDALRRLSELCLVASNPWSLNPKEATAPELVERVREMSKDFVESMAHMKVESGGRYTTLTPFGESPYAKAFAKVCTDKKPSRAQADADTKQ